ncbi:MAG: hypothetical protein AAF602_10635 [Myxococcota bacterium]
MLLRASTLVGLTFATGCIFGGSDLPRDGMWTIGEPVVAANDCGLDLAEIGYEAPTGFNLFREIDGTFTLVTTDEDAEELECTLQLDVFSCETDSFTVPLGPTSLDIRTLLSSTDAGPRSIDFVQALDADCVGGNGSTGCKVAKAELEVEELPCNVNVGLEATWESEDLGPLQEVTPAQQ